METPIDFCTTVDEQSNREVASLWRDDLMALMHGREEHNKLIRACSPLVTEEDGSDLIPNWCRVQNALMRLVSERNEYRRELNRMIDAYRGQITRFGTYGDEIDAAIAAITKHSAE